MIRILLLIAMTLIFFSCQERRYGSITVNLKDGPADYEELNLDIEKAEVYVHCGKESGWYKLKTNAGIYNILLFQNTSALIATQDRIPEGRISLVKLTLGYQNSLKADNIYYPLQTKHKPGEKFHLLVAADCSVAEHDMLNILLDVDADRSLSRSARGQYILNPVAVAGTVGSPLDVY